VIRPHASLEEFYATDLGTISATTIVLLGAQRRPDGVVLRFEVLLCDETPLIRGEGRVIGYMDRTPLGEPGLCLKLKRVDPHSKEILDEALRRKGQGRKPAASVPPEPSRRVPPPLRGRRSVSPAAATEPQHAMAQEPEPAAIVVDVSDLVMLDEPGPSEETPSVSPPPPAAVAPDERAERLNRLRSRLRDLRPEVRDAILDDGRALRSRAR
jgi:hypothetical protein